MALRLKIENIELRKEESSYLDADAAADATTLTVRNNDNFTANRWLIIGEPGQEQTEQAKIASTSSNTTVVIATGLKFAHPKSTPLYESGYDKVQVQRTPTGSESWSAISGSPFTLDWDNYDEYGKITTLIEDSSGSSASHSYRWRFYNSATGGYTAWSGTLPGTGLARDTAGFIIQKVRRNSITRGVADEVLYHYINDLQDIVYEQMPKAWWFSKTGTEVATEASTSSYSISDNWSDFLSMQYLLYRYISGSTDNTYPLNFVPELEYYDFKADANKPESDTARRWTLLPPDSDSAKGYIGIDPTPESDDCYIKPIYFFELSDIDSFEDTLVIPKPKIYEDYIFYRIYDDIKNDDANAEKFDIRVASSIQALKLRTKRQKGQRTWRRYRGPRGYQNLFGRYSAGSTDEYRENYW